MRSLFRWAFVVSALAAAFTASAAAQQPGGLIGDLLRDIAEVEEKLVGLARAIPADKYGWRPGEGVRSVGEVFMHVAADNYVLPAGLGVAPAASTGIKAEDYNTVQRMWILATTHLHEHLGQSIAYARSNGIVPPWSRGGQ